MNNKKLLKCFMCCSAIFVALPSMAQSNIGNAKQGGGSGKTVLDSVDVKGVYDAAEKSRTNIYQSTITRDYYNKEDISKKFIGNPGDLISGTTGVFSADSRNSGAIDVNIRGIQGQSRVPLTVDGTEQSITVYRGMSGVNNRNYIDPALISEVFVDKGMVLSKDSGGSVGGAVRMTTLTADDVVLPGQKFGVRVSMDQSSNSAKNRYPNFYFDKYRTEYPVDWFNPYEDTSMWLSPAKKSSIFGSLRNDRSVLISAGAKTDLIEAVLAYSYRNKGNHFSGKNGAGYYKEVNRKGEAFQKSMTDFFIPGGEVPNTHSNTKSVLGKFKLKPTDDQSIEAIVRKSEMKFGEIMPYRLYAVEDIMQEFVVTGKEKDLRVGSAYEFWPDSKMDVTAYSVEYGANPKDNPWIDFSAQLWHTKAEGLMNSDEKTVLDIAFKCRGINDKAVVDQDPDCYFFNQALFKVDNKRTGFNAGNTFELSSTLKLSLAAALEKEKRVKDTDFGADKYEAKNDLLQRDVSRSEYKMSFNFEWKPTDWFTLNAGMRKTNASGRDRATDPDIVLSYTDKIRYTVMRKLSDKDKIEKLVSGEWSLPQYKQYESITMPDEVPSVFDWYPDNHGHFHISNNPFLNGDMIKWYQETGNQPFAAGQGSQGTTTGSAGRDGGIKVKQHITTKKYREIANKDYSTPWAPILSAEIKVTPDLRLLAHYSESWRAPNIYEMYPLINLSSGKSISSRYLSPEKATNIEAGVSYDMSGFFEDSYADVRLTYFQNKLEDMLDKDTGTMDNVGKLKTRGIELQGRYSGDHLDVKVGVTANFKNQFCQYGVDIGPYQTSEPKDFNNNWITTDHEGNVHGVGSVIPVTPTCYEGGKPMGLVASMVQPELSANLDVSGKFFDQKLLIGTNIRWFSKYSGYYQTTIEKTKSNHAFVGVPLGWGSTATVDFYMNYDISKNVSVKANIHNLTNQYYLDPLSRAYMPAPGRTFTLGFTAKF